LERQVRIEGRVEKISRAESERYFQSRPRGSQIGAAASNQSQVVANRTVLETRFQDLEARYAEQDIPTPAHWGGYRLTPDLLEFWQGRRNRLHDRLRYRLLDSGDWSIERLEP
ncbi:MAG: pyridoxal 5'-phosphate synthase, partial [Candidatus Competibacteraceae bacterium]|nr:pyridoxal 5'-phosphate synthase [Candidatus Competibacteraceae bacterium]